MADGHLRLPSGTRRAVSVGLRADGYLGLREELFDIARKIAVVGYHCIVPNFWYRQGRVRFEHRDAKDHMLSFEHIPDETKQAMRKQMALLTDEMGDGRHQGGAQLSTHAAGDRTAQKARSAIASAAAYALQMMACFPTISASPRACMARGW